MALLGLGCAVLSMLFSSLGLSWIRLGFETLALAGCGLFVGELLRNRRLTLAAQERLRILIETSPAAIVTVDSRGSIELSNRGRRGVVGSTGWESGSQSYRSISSRIALCIAVGRRTPVPDSPAM